MSKLVVSYYRVPSEEERRATLQKIALVRQMLQRCVALCEALERFEHVEMPAFSRRPSSIFGGCACIRGASVSGRNHREGAECTRHS